jgi:hypothetical protein
MEQEQQQQQEQQSSEFQLAESLFEEFMENPRQEGETEGEPALNTGLTLPAKQITGQSMGSELSLWGSDNSGSSSSSSSSSTALTTQDVLLMFSQSARQLQVAAENISQLQHYAARIDATVTSVKNNVEGLQKDLQHKYQHLAGKQNQMEQQLEQIHEHQSSWATELSSSSVSRVVVSFLMKHAFNTAEGQVAGIPFFSCHDGHCDDPELLIGVHVPLLNFMFRSLYGKSYNTKFLNLGLFRAVMQRLFEQRTQLHEDDYKYLNSVAPVKTALKDTKKSGGNNWVVFTARRMFETVVYLKKQLDKGKHETPLHSFDGWGLPKDVFTPPIAVAARSPVTAAVTTPTRMAFGTPAWQECLDTKAWCKFMLLMKEAMIQYLPHDQRQAAENFYSQSEIPPLRLLKPWCCPRLKTVIKTFAETKAAEPAAAAPAVPPKTRSKASKRPREEDEEEEKAQGSDSGDSDDDDISPEIKRLRKAA